MADPATNIRPTCPFCYSAKVVTQAKKKTPSPYSRCDDCGAVWHPDRVPAVGMRRTVGR